MSLFPSCAAPSCRAARLDVPHVLTRTCASSHPPPHIHLPTRLRAENRGAKDLISDYWQNLNKSTKAKTVSASKGRKSASAKKPPPPSDPPSEPEESPAPPKKRGRPPKSDSASAALAHNDESESEDSLQLRIRSKFRHVPNTSHVSRAPSIELEQRFLPPPLFPA